MEMADLGRSMQLAGNRNSRPVTTLNGSVSSKQRDSAHPDECTFSKDLMHAKNVAQMDRALQKSLKRVVNKRHQIPPRGLVKPKDEVNESVRTKMRESLASALSLVQQHEEFPKGKKNVKTEENLVVNPDNTQNFQPTSPASFSIPIVEGTMSEFAAGVERSLQKDSEISVEIRREDANQADGLPVEI